MRATHLMLETSRDLFAVEPFRLVRGLIATYVAYPIAERVEKRDVRSKLVALRLHYRQSAAAREAAGRNRLAETVAFAGNTVPYYRDLFAARRFDPEKLRFDPRYLEDLPVLTKDTIREQGERLLSRPLAEVRHRISKTGGSTGVSAVIYYDQNGADHAAAVVLYCRERIGKKRRLPETHLAARFGDLKPEPWPSREDFKCFAMNRSNIFFDRVDPQGLAEMWQQLVRRPPYLLHGHPSTAYALAQHVALIHGAGRAFSVFESSGELLEPHMRETIARILGCRVVDRYGLAELGVIAYELEGDGLRVLDSEVWPESRPSREGLPPELVFTGFSNRLMPLIRYATGDLGVVERDERGFRITQMVGRIHDRVSLAGVDYLTHHIQDVLDHRVRGIQDFQIDARTTPPVLRLVLEPSADPEETKARIERHWPGAFRIEFAGQADFIRVGNRAKFRHVVTP